MGMSQNFFQRSGVAEIGNWSQLNAPGKQKKKKKKKNARSHERATRLLSFSW